MQANYLLKLPQPIAKTQTPVQQVLQIISKANYGIWMKNIWFFNPGLQGVLIQKAKTNVSVEIILPENFVEMNKEWISFREFIDAGIEIFIGPARPQPERYKLLLVDYSIVVEPFENVYVELKKRYNGQPTRPNIKQMQQQFMAYKKNTKNLYQ